MNRTKSHDVVKGQLRQNKNYVNKLTSFIKIDIFTDKSKYENGSISSQSNMKQPSNDKSVSMSNNEKYEAKKSIVILVAIFLISLTAMFYVYFNFPNLEEYGILFFIS